MKKLISIIILFSIYTFVLPAVHATAAPTSALSGPTAIRANDTITIIFSVNGSGLCAVHGEIKYDSAKLIYKGNSGVLTGWAMDIDGSTAGEVTFLGMDDKLAAPINTKKQLFAMTFLVKSNVTKGAKIEITTANLATSDGDTDMTITNASFSASIAAPLSSDAFLSSLIVTNAVLSPTFSENILSYTAAVPFSTSKLEITALTKDAKAKVSISGNNLIAGATTDVTITATAESGTKKSYIIKVTRAKDPDYQASSINTLSAITIDGFRLSPLFKPDITSYVVWLPYETDKIFVAGKATDEKASVAVIGDVTLQAGQDNPIKIVCTAEDGTIMEYLIIAKRATLFHADTIAPSTLTPTSTWTGTLPTNTLTSISTNNNSNTNSNKIELWKIILFAIAFTLLGILIGKCSCKRR